MPYVNLILSNAVIHYNTGRGPSGWQMSYETRLRRWHEEVELSTGGKLSEMTGQLFLRASEERDDEVVATLYHLPEYPGGADQFIAHSDESYSVEFVLSPDEVMALIGAERIGRGAIGASISVEKLTYGYAPDGSQKKWDNANDPHLPVKGATFTFGPEPEPEREPDEPPPPPKNTVEFTLRAIHNDLKQWGMWIVVILGLIAISILWKR